MAKFYDGDIGTVLQVETGADFTVLTDASVILVVKYPGDATTEHTWTVTMPTLADEKGKGLVRHILDSTAELVGPGTYTLQALVYENPGVNANQWYGETTSFVISSRWT